LYSASTRNVSKALRYNTHCQGISQFYLHTLRFIRKRNEPYLPLPSQPQLVLIFRPRRDGRLSRPGLLLLCYVIHPKEPLRDFFASVTDLAGSRERAGSEIHPWTQRDVVANAGHSLSHCSKVSQPSPHFGHVGSTKGSMTYRYARSRLL